MCEIDSSAAEAELGGLFHNGKDACPIRTCLEELGHPQPPTPLQTDNTTADGIANDTVKQKRSKAINMHFYWIRDRVRQGQFHVYWIKGDSNQSDYFTKHFPARHHQDVRPDYLYQANSASQHSNYYEPLDNDDDDEEVSYYAFSVCFSPSVSVYPQSRLRLLTPNILLYKIVPIHVRVC
jgi:hypothetical protein